MNAMPEIETLVVEDAVFPVGCGGKGEITGDGADEEKSVDEIK